MKYKIEISALFRGCQIWSGIMMLLYLLLHFSVVSGLLFGEEFFVKLINFYNRPLFLIIEQLMMVGILFHILNGLRLLALYFGLWWSEDDDLRATVLVGTSVLGIFHLFRALT